MSSEDRLSYMAETISSVIGKNSETPIRPRNPVFLHSLHPVAL